MLSVECSFKVWQNDEKQASKCYYVHFLFFSIQIDATIYVGGLDEKVAETLLWELFLQAGPVGKQRLLVLISYQATRVEILYIIATQCTVCAVCILIDLKVISVGDTLALDSG